MIVKIAGMIHVRITIKRLSGYGRIFHLDYVATQSL